MLGSRISDMLDQELSQQQAVGGVALVTDESRQKQLLQEDEEEDFLDEGRKNYLLLQVQDSCTTEYRTVDYEKNAQLHVMPHMP